VSETFTRYTIPASHKYSDGVITLLKTLLEPDCDKRISITQCLKEVTVLQGGGKLARRGSQERSSYVEPEESLTKGRGRAKSRAGSGGGGGGGGSGGGGGGGDADADALADADADEGGGGEATLMKKALPTPAKKKAPKTPPSAKKKAPKAPPKDRYSQNLSFNNPLI